MIISGFRDYFNGKGLKIKDFNPKMINDLARNHPYQQAMFGVYKYYCSYVDGMEGDLLKEIDYFKMLDRYYRY